MDGREANVAPDTAERLASLEAGLARAGAACALGLPRERGALLEEIVGTAMRVLGARAGSLYLVDEGAEDLVFAVALGERAAPLRGRRLPLGEGIAGWVAAMGQAIALADVAGDPRWARQIGTAVDYTPRTMLALPLLLDDRVVGVLQLLDKSDGVSFTAADIATLGLFARLAAIAIAQAQALGDLAGSLGATFDAADGDPAARTAPSAGYRDTLRLAELLGEIGRHGPAGRRLGLEVVTAVARFLRAGP